MSDKPANGLIDLATAGNIKPINWYNNVNSYIVNTPTSVSIFVAGKSYVATSIKQLLNLLEKLFA
jgi:hypothetical protein